MTAEETAMAELEAELTGDVDMAEAIMDHAEAEEAAAKAALAANDIKPKSRKKSKSKKTETAPKTMTYDFAEVAAKLDAVKKYTVSDLDLDKESLFVETPTEKFHVWTRNKNTDTAAIMLDIQIVDKAIHPDSRKMTEGTTSDSLFRRVRRYIRTNDTPTTKD